MNNDSTEATFLGRVEHKIGKEYTDVTAGFSYGLPKAADQVGVWFEGNVISNNLSTFTGDFSAVFGFDKQYFLGSKAVGDFKAQKVTEMHGFVAAKLADYFIFLSSNCYQRKIKIGFSTSSFEYFNKLYAETNIEFDDKYNFKGSPSSTVAFENKINDDTKFKTKIDISQDINVDLSFVHKISPTLQLTIGDYMNPLGFFKNPGENMYKLGVSLEANL